MPMALPPMLHQYGEGFRDIPPTMDHIDASAERMGVMSLTLSPSPVVRWILPARIRSHRKNDVMFIGSTYIQLREFNDNGQLSDTTAKLDFGTQILNAKVISAKAELVPTLDKILDQEWDEERFIIKGEPCKDGQPPQIVVLVTTSNELIYIYAKDSWNGKNVDFVYAKRPLLDGYSGFEISPKHLAVDPESKIMALAWNDTCTLLSLREVDDLKKSIDSWDPRKPQSFQPNPEQRMIQIDGFIHRMEFLRASAEEPEKAILLLLVANRGKCTPLFYRWDTRKPLDQAEPFNSPFTSLAQDDKLPLLLIPLQKQTVFAIVTETNIWFYDQRVSPRPKPEPLPATMQGDKIQLWTSWAKPSRHERYSSENEDILLVREDGYLRVFNRRHSDGFLKNFLPGIVGIGVESAMCMLPGPRLMGGDILIVAGSMCDGGVFHVAARRELHMLQVIPNVSPIYDATTLVHKQKDAKSRRTFVTAGRSQSGDLNELRYGREAQIGWTMPSSENKTVNQLWALEHPASKTLFLLASHLEHTTVIALDLEKQQLEELSLELFPALQLDTPTLAADMLKCGTSIQITSNRITAGFETSTPATENIGDCVCAEIDYVSGTFVIACKVAVEYHIKVGLINQLEAQPSILLSPSHYFSTDRPLCLALFHLGDVQYVSAGFSDGHIEIFLIDKDGRLISEGRLSLQSDDITPITSVVVLDHALISRAIVLAGTRDGKLHVVRVSSADDNIRSSINLVLDRSYWIGETQVAVVADRGSRDDSSVGALVQCGSRLDQIVCYKNNHDIDYMLVHIWLSIRNDLTYVPPNLLAVQRIRDLESINGGQPSRFIMCATKDEVLFAELIEQEQMIPRRTGLSRDGGQLLTFSDLLNKFVVTSNPSQKSYTTNNREHEPEKYPLLRIVDPDRVYENTEHAVEVILGEPYESVKLLMPWKPTDGRSHFNFIMVGLNSETSSRLGFVSARKLLTRSTTASFKELKKFKNKKLHALCPVDESYLAVSVGFELVLMRLDVSSKNWHVDGRYSLPSPALSLCAQNTVIYAALQSHSIIVLSWRKSVKRFEVILTDHAAKDARHVVPFLKNEDHLLLSTSKGTGTSIFAYRTKQTSPTISITSSTTTTISTPLFEAELPLSTQRILPISTSWPNRSHHAFQLISLDGTVSILETLAHAELKLLRFVERLAYPDPITTPSKKQKTISMLTEKMARSCIRGAKEQRLTIFNPRNMHVNGDVLKRVVEKGPDHLRELLGVVVVKHEDDDSMSVDDGGEHRSPMARLEVLAKPVLGGNDSTGTKYLPERVVAWIRMLLRATIF